MESQSIIQRPNKINKIYGFGSFFRGEPYNDIDLLILINEKGEEDMTSSVNEIIAWSKTLSQKIGCDIDCLILTELEYHEKPLLDMNELRLLWKQ